PEAALIARVCGASSKCMALSSRPLTAQTIATQNQKGPDPQGPAPIRPFTNYYSRTTTHRFTPAYAMAMNRPLRLRASTRPCVVCARAELHGRAELYGGL